MTIESTRLQSLNLFMTLFPFFVSSTVVGVRIWRKIRQSNLTADDIIVIIAQVLAFGLTVVTCIFIKKSYIGYRSEDIPEGALNKTEASKWRFVIAVMYNPVLALIKVSFIVTLIKLEPPSVWVRGSLWILFTVNIMFGIAGTLVALLNCRPIPKFWDRTIPGHCMNTAQYIYGTICVTIIKDALVSIVPVFILFGLQMPRRTKALVISFLSLGLVVTAIASYRLSVFVKVFSMNNPLQNESPHNVRTPLSNIEASLAVIAACGPTLKYIIELAVTTLRNNRSMSKSADLEWDMANRNQMNTKKNHAVTSSIHHARNTNSSTVELAGALVWPIASNKSSRSISEEKNGSIKTVLSTVADKSNGSVCEKSRSLV